MSDPYFGTPRYSRSDDDRFSSPPVIDGTPYGGGAWLLGALALAAIVAVLFFGTAPPAGDQQAGAPKAPVTDIDTTGQATPRPEYHDDLVIHCLLICWRPARLSTGRRT